MENNKKAVFKGTAFSYAYPQDLDHAYAFYCARYENISFEQFLNLGFLEFKKKLNSLPESEPLFNIIKSRTINLKKIKDKNEKKYWTSMKKINKIPDIYLSTKELEKITKNKIKKTKGI